MDHTAAAGSTNACSKRAHFLLIHELKHQYMEKSLPRIGIGVVIRTHSPYDFIASRRKRSPIPRQNEHSGDFHDRGIIVFYEFK
ncbi:hypothetical protein [Trinickia sp.]|uniref:hypothetical protein n=1 Tax=Trinickia sp. TaxID=2571163 RepID=UPI003F7EA097